MQVGAIQMKQRSFYWISVTKILALYLNSNLKLIIIEVTLKKISNWRNNVIIFELMVISHKMRRLISLNRDLEE